MIHKERTLQELDLLGGEQPHGGAPSAKLRLVAGVLGQHADHLPGDDGTAPGGILCPLCRIPGVGLGDLFQLLRQGEGIQGPHVLIKGHARAFRIARALLPHGQITQKHELLRRAQFGPAAIKLRLPISGPQGGRPRKHGRPILLFCADAQHPLPSRRLHKGANLIALKNHVLVVGTDAPALKHRRPQGLLEEMDELAEMGGPLYGRPGKAQLVRHIVVVDRQVAIVFLRTQHLPRMAIGPR